MITLSLSTLFCGAAYRMRGGGFFSFPSSFAPRAIWGTVIALAYFFTAIPNSLVRDIYAPLLIFISYAALMVPHAYCQNMGRWPDPQIRWPSFYMPVLTRRDWCLLTSTQRFFYDFASMFGVALFRGLITFLPFLLICKYATGIWPVSETAAAIAVLSIGQPVAYALGYHIPITLGGSLRARGTEWGEFFNGMVWAFAVACL